MSVSTPDPESFEFERGHRRRQRLIGLGIALAVLGPASWVAFDRYEATAEKTAARLTADQKAELVKALDGFEARARDGIAAWNQALSRDALAKAVIGELRCAVTVTPPPQMSAAAYVKYGTHDVAFGNWTLCILRPSAEPASCARTPAVDPDVTAIRARLAEDDVYTWDLDRAKATLLRPEPAAVLVVVDNEVKPEIHSEVVGRVTFAPGTLAGKALLFDAGRFVCGAAVSVRNTRTVDIEYPHFDEGPEEQRKMAETETRAALERDLEMHLRYATAKGLRQLQPP